ncbi:DUF3488 and transglutaminase-like domain-containing protein, partial [uncultured Microbacterium sp.]|uniref:transglutaminase family protein n=1 Tax=uncultured Microbacterium sp. TaxID=191216 RepID=UPI0026359830
MVAPSPVQRARVIRARREAAIGSALLAAAAGFIALWPYTAVISPGRWSMFTVVVIIVVTGSGLLTRVIAARHPDRALFALGVELVAAIGAVTFLTVPRDAVFGFIPTGVALRSWARHLGDAADQIVYGKAPLEATFALAAVLAIAFALVAILLEQLVTQNLALVAIVLTAIVGSLPMIISGAEANVPWFVLLALLAFFLLRRTARRSSGAPRRASIIMTIGIGAASIVATLVFAPVMPVSTTWAGAGVSAQVNASLRLGDDLRRPDPFTVMTVATRATTAPYLRVATLSSFDGETWEPDDLDRQPLSDGFGGTEWSDDLDAPQQRTSVKVNNLSSSWLPVPYAATKIIGVGSAWEIIPENRTLYSETADAADQDYTVTSRSVQPTKEQIQAATATPVPAGGAAADLPAVIGESARTVTADATNDYDRALALQSWFRSDFSYSLDAPVERGFDGTGTDAVVAFLDEREGYCIHFAGAFALMAQSLDMQVRIVVGYLPGTVTDHKRGAEFLYEVSSDQL